MDIKNKMKKHIIYHIIIAACLSQLFVDHLAAQPVPNFTQPCNGSLGSIELIMPVGVPEGYYTFLWQDEADQTIGTEKDIYNLPTGTYSVLISDPNGCSGYFIYDLGLRAFFTLTPKDCLNDPNFDANNGWENAFGTNNYIVAQDASIGENIVAYGFAICRYFNAISASFCY